MPRLASLALCCAIGATPLTTPRPPAPRATRPARADTLDALARTDTLVPSEAGVLVFVREVRATGPHRREGVPVVLVHGGGPGGLVSFDLDVPGYSVAAELARAGHPAYVMDVRGWGASTRPAALDAPPDANAPAVSARDAATDIAAVVEYARRRTGAPRVALLGWASGGHWAAAYTTRHNDRVSHLILLNTLYGVSAPWPMRARLEAPGHPGELDPAIGAYLLRTPESLLRGWTASIPTGDAGSWRDPRVADAYVRGALRSDPTSRRRVPPSMRVPAGYLAEAYAMSRGTRYWSARDIRVPTLVVRGALDFWSRPEDIASLRRELSASPRVRVVTIPGATHYLLFDRPEHGRARFMALVRRFLSR